MEMVTDLWVIFSSEHMKIRLFFFLFFAKLIIDIGKLHGNTVT